MGYIEDGGYGEWARNTEKREKGKGQMELDDLGCIYIVSIHMRVPGNPLQFLQLSVTDRGGLENGTLIHVSSLPLVCPPTLQLEQQQKQAS